MKMKKREGFSFGAVTLFMMFVVLSMVILTSLSLLAAKHEQKVAEKEKMELIKTYQQEAALECISKTLDQHGPDDQELVAAHLEDVLEQLQITGKIEWNDEQLITHLQLDQDSAIITAIWQDGWIIDSVKKER